MLAEVGVKTAGGGPPPGMVAGGPAGGTLVTNVTCGTVTTEVSVVGGPEAVTI